MALSYFNMTQAAYDQAEKAGKGMNIAMGHGKECIAAFESAKSVVNMLGGAYKANYDKKTKECAELCQKAENDNKKIYYEAAVAKEDLPKPDPQNFANFSSLADEVGKTPELDGKLRHLVPPAV